MDDKAIATEENKDNQEQGQSNDQPSASSSVRERFATSSPVLQEFEAVNEESQGQNQEIVNEAPEYIDGNQPSTYVEIVTETDATGQPLSVLEVDLIISREKGEEKRRLAINFAAIEGDTMIEKSVSIKRESFEELKKFFCQLDWNS